MEAVVTDALPARAADRRLQAARAVGALVAVLVGISSVVLLKAPWSATSPGGASVAHPGLVAWHVAAEASVDLVLVALLVAFAARARSYRTVAAVSSGLAAVVVLVNLPAAGPAILITSAAFLLPAALAYSAGLLRQVVGAIGRRRLWAAAAAVVAAPGLPYATWCLAAQRTDSDDVARAHAYASTAEHVVLVLLLLLLVSTALPGTRLLGWSLVLTGIYLAAAAASSHGPGAPGSVGAVALALAAMVLAVDMVRTRSAVSR